MSNMCNPKLLQAIFDYSLHATSCWRRLSIITNLFLNWCVYHGHVPPLDGANAGKAGEPSSVGRDTGPKAESCGDQVVAAYAAVFKARRRECVSAGGVPGTAESTASYTRG
jgi:hypothetical protein